MKLGDGIDIFLARLRVDGRSHDNVEVILRSFSRHLGGDTRLENIKPNTILEFIEGPKTRAPATWQLKHSALRRLVEFWVQRGALAHSCMPKKQPYVRRPFVPHIYTRQEILSLLRAIKSQTKTQKVVLAPETMKVLFVTLYGTGARIRELRGLLTSNLDLRSGFVRLGEVRFGSERKIPLNRELVGILQRYADWRVRNGIHEAHFFTRTNRGPVDPRDLNRPFDRIRRRAHLAWFEAGQGSLRMKDLRPTLAPPGGTGTSMGTRSLRV